MFISCGQTCITGNAFALGKFSMKKNNKNQNKPAPVSYPGGLSTHISSVEIIRSLTI